MPFQIRCSCGQVYQLPDELAGKKARCQSCQKIFQVPANPGQAAPQPSPQTPRSPQPGTQPVQQQPVQQQPVQQQPVQQQPVQQQPVQQQPVQQQPVQQQPVQQQPVQQQPVQPLGSPPQAGGMYPQAGQPTQAQPMQPMPGQPMQYSYPGQQSGYNKKKKKSSARNYWIIGGSVGGVIVLVVVGIILFSGPGNKNNTEQASNNSSKQTSNDSNGQDDSNQSSDGESSPRKSSQGSTTNTVSRSGSNVAGVGLDKFELMGKLDMSLDSIRISFQPGNALMVTGSGNVYSQRFMASAPLVIRTEKNTRGHSVGRTGRYVGTLTDNQLVMYDAQLGGAPKKMSTTGFSQDMLKLRMISDTEAYLTDGKKYQIVNPKQGKVLKEFEIAIPSTATIQQFEFCNNLVILLASNGTIYEFDNVSGKTKATSCKIASSSPIYVCDQRQLVFYTADEQSKSFLYQAEFDRDKKTRIIELKKGIPNPVRYANDKMVCLPESALANGADSGRDVIIHIDDNSSKVVAKLPGGFECYEAYRSRVAGTSRATAISRDTGEIKQWYLKEEVFGSSSLVARNNNSPTRNKTAGTSKPSGNTTRLSAINVKPLSNAAEFPSLAEVFIPSGDAKVIVGRDLGGVWLWREGAGGFSQLANTPLLNQAISKDGRFLVGNSKQVLHAWDLTTKKLISTLEVGTFSTSIYVNSDGRTATVAMRKERILWDFQQNKIIFRRPHLPAIANSIRVQMGANGTDYSVFTTTDKCYRVEKGRSKELPAKFSPLDILQVDGKGDAVFITRKDTGGKVKLIKVDLKTGAQSEMLKTDQLLPGEFFANQAGTMFVIKVKDPNNSTMKRTLIFDSTVSPAKQIGALPNNAHQMAFSNSGKTIVALNAQSSVVQRWKVQ